MLGTSNYQMYALKIAFLRPMLMPKLMTKELHPYGTAKGTRPKLVTR